MVTPQAGNTPIDEIRRIKGQIGKFTTLQALIFLLPIGAFIADLSGKIPDPPGSAIVAGGSLAVAFMTFRVLQMKKKQFSAELTTLQNSAGTRDSAPIAAPE